VWRVRAVTGLIGAAGGFATVSVLAKLGYREGAQPTSLLAGRVVVAAIVLMAASATCRSGVTARQLALGMLGGAAFAGAGLCEFEALYRASVANVVLLVFLAPVWVAVASWLIWRSAPGWLQAGAVALVLLGTGLLVGGPGGQRIAAGAAGLALLASGLSAVFFLITSRLVPEIGARRAGGLLGAGAAALSLAVTNDAALAELGTPRRAGLALAIGVLTAASLLLLAGGLGRTAALTGSAIAGAEPALAAALSWPVLGERLSPVQVGGGAAVVFGVTLLGLHVADLTGPAPAVEPDGSHQDDPHHDVLPEPLDAADEQTVREHDGDEDADNRRAHDADAAGEARPADDHRGEGGDQLGRVPGGDARDAEAR
jgi:drug/metabolite transporter (DMT)-like permease